MADIFRLKERPDLGGFKPRDGEPVEFVWDRAHRNIPIQSWEFGGQLRTNRTDYPGGNQVTEQVMGPNHTPFTFEGRWMDKFNPMTGITPGGYALKEMEAFEALCFRGNVVQITLTSPLGQIEIQGIINDWTFDYKGHWDIGYSFTVSPHQRARDAKILQPVVPSNNKDPETLSKEIRDRINKDLKTIKRSSEKLAGDASSRTRAQVDSLSDASDILSTVVSNRVLATGTDSKISIQGAIAAATSIINSAQALINNVNQMRSDTDLMYQDALGVLDFETWSRGLAAQSRLSIFQADDARNQLDEQQSPDAIALYRPQKNESLYRISERFYGTPHNWNIIKQRNNLTSSKLTGSELLIIPEAPPA